ncbi:hypothetical protein AHAS_Ahas11G0358900 [Arachis hypogaea]
MAEDDIDENDPNSEDKWYKDDESNGKEDKPFDPCLVILVSKEEFDECLQRRKTTHMSCLGVPWMVGGPYLIVQRWLPFFLKSEKVVKKVTAWVRIPNLPIQLYNHRFLWRVGSAIGTILKVDRATSLHSRGRFARICVEIDLTKKLVPRISVLGSMLNIEYEGLDERIS